MMEHAAEAGIIYKRAKKRKNNKCAGQPDPKPFELRVTRVGSKRVRGSSFDEPSLDSQERDQRNINKLTL